MRMRVMHSTFRSTALCGVILMVVAGCNKKADNTTNYTSAINNYYSAHPTCLFAEPMKFPVQESTSDVSKTTPYDALVDQGLLVRTTAEKKVMIVASKQVNNYDLSDQGRSVWTADATQPGFGNFCYGHRKVSRIDSSTPTTSDPGATTQVSYHYGIVDAPGWATAAETQNAFPKVQADLAGTQAATATLTNTSNGWQVSSILDSNSNPPSSSDGKIVQ